MLRRFMTGNWRNTSLDQEEENVMLITDSLKKLSRWLKLPVRRLVFSLVVLYVYFHKLHPLNLHFTRIKIL